MKWFCLVRNLRDQGTVSEFNVDWTLIHFRCNFIINLGSLVLLHVFTVAIKVKKKEKEKAVGRACPLAVHEVRTVCAGFTLISWSLCSK